MLSFFRKKNSESDVVKFGSVRSVVVDANVRFCFLFLMFVYILDFSSYRKFTIPICLSLAIKARKSLSKVSMIFFGQSRIQKSQQL